MSFISSNNYEFNYHKFIYKNPKIHNEGIKSQHWQLKDMLKTYENKLLFSQHNKVFLYDTKLKQKKILANELKFYPASLNAYKNYLVVGGANGQLYIKNLETKTFLISSISNSINNHINISEDAIYISNNDRNLKIITLDLENLLQINFPSQVNHSCVSPDNKYLVLVGDSNDVFLYGIEKLHYRLIAKLKTVNDGGFCVSWNKLSNIQQCGTPKGAVRSVFFSKKHSIDLLFFTEQYSYINVYDTRTFEHRQINNVKDSMLTGSTILENDYKVFVSTETEIFEYDIDTVIRRIFGGI
ncbi:wd40 yvtn repeat-like protein [Vairimorpha apis BRL 01]|uniref:Wd40 yvtn repeat-like protein n=1 Tax=Vairimorpha apis BRL 01 TaxID=1037528 RepID=T0LC67_9MICR|nr:wd40 yvtn repeat-like protein [Vairimorpha apis BRL 01]